MSNVINPIPIFDSIENLSTELSVSIFTQAGLEKKAMNSDYQKSLEFIKSYRGSPATFNAYRRELERFLQWSWFIAKKNLKELKRADIETFIEFCLKPPKTWIGFNQLPRFITQGGFRVINPEWRPFVVTISKKQRIDGVEADKAKYQLSQAGIQAIFAILGSFYNFLIQEDYLEINPVLQIRQKSKFIRKQQGTKQIRRLSDLQWVYVIETANLLADAEPEKHERTLFIMSALYGMYLRISELAASQRWEPQMGHFFRDHYNNWWFKTVGKGNKERNITVSDAMLAVLKRYRNYLGLSPLPAPNETNPLLPKTKGFGAISDTRYIRRIVQGCFDAAVERLRKDNLSDEADQLMSATVHWLRHTGISDDVKRRPREHVRDDAGHSSGAITDRYIDVELLKRHQSGKKKLIVPEDV